jgi:hypothetical protein
MFKEYLGIVLDQIKEINAAQDKEKEIIFDEYQKTFDYPRKKKKRVRKELNLRWRIANYDLFGMREMEEELEIDTKKVMMDIFSKFEDSYNDKY